MTKTTETANHTETTTVRAPWTGTATVDFLTRQAMRRVELDTLQAMRREAVGEQPLDVAEIIKQANSYAAEMRPRHNPHVILSTAANIIRAQGWHQGDQQSDTGAVCLWRAIGIAAGNNHGAASSASRIVYDRIAQRYTETGGGIPAWNDMPGRTVDQVLAVLEG